MKRRGPPLVSAAKRVRATKSRQRLAHRAIDIDEHGTVLGLTPALQQAASYELAGDAGAELRRPAPGVIIPDLDDLEGVAKWIADIAMVPIEIVLAIIRKLEGLPKFLLVGFVLYELTKREHRARAQPRR